MNAIILALAVGLGVFDLAEPFDYADGTDGSPRWTLDAVAWEVQGGKMTYSSGARGFAIAEEAPFASEMTVETSIKPVKREGTEWCTVGVALRQDKDNFWHLALVESPISDEGKHFVELCEMMDGQWLSQSAPETKLTVKAWDGGDFNWKYGQTYRLRLVLTPQQIEGFVFETTPSEAVAQYETAPTPVAHLAFAFDNRAVTMGQPALDCSGFTTSFDDVSIKVTQEAAAPKNEEPTFPPYTVPGYDKVKYTETGFFHTAGDITRWLIDPNGQGFYIVGVDHVNYNVHWCEALGYAPYARNVAEKYGSEEKWADATEKRLKDWGFNTLTANHSRMLRYRQFPHIEFLSMGASFSDVDDLCPKTTWTGFPNVFSPKWARHCELLARQACAPVKGDPWLIGYFLDNELEWFGKNYKKWGLFDEAWKKPAGNTAKQAWIAFLKEEVKDPARFKEYWGVEIASLDDLAVNVEPASPKSAEAEAVAEKWVQLVARKYFETCRDAIKKHDPNHLILGCRFAGDAPNVWSIAGEFCDVVSFNMYPRIDVREGVPESVINTIRGWQEKTNRPMMITEWSFPALDSGLPCKHGAGMRVDTQEQRARCFGFFQRTMFRLPFMVGSDYFMWVDEPALGISKTFPEDSNYGLVKENDEPYEEITKMAFYRNSQAYIEREDGTSPSGKSVFWLDEMPKALPEAKTDFRLPVQVSKGDLLLTGPLDGRAWQASYKGTQLGDFVPVIHQEGDAPFWARPDSARVTAVYETDDATIVDMEFSLSVHGTGEDNRNASGTPPFSFCTGWRFWTKSTSAYRWFAAQCLWVENTAETDWKLASIYHYFLPSIGGDSKGDVPVLDEIPNYYIDGAGWFDPEAKIGIGCLYPEEKGFSCSYWIDPQGGFHPDLREEVGVVLKKGERYERTDAPLSFFFPFACAKSPSGTEAAVSPRRAFSDAWNRVNVDIHRRRVTGSYDHHLPPGA